MPRDSGQFSASAILSLRPEDVGVNWRCTIPRSGYNDSEGLRECELRLAKEAAAEAGFDEIIIT